MMPATEGQQTALAEIRRIAAASPGALEEISVGLPDKQGGALLVDVSIDCSGIESTQDGLQYRSRERFRIWIPPEFPFGHPSVWTPHTRFAGTPHVQWKKHLCLYQAPSYEWNASDGMYGFFDRLELWLKRAAKNQLDAEGAPLHPPVAYASEWAKTIIPRKDTPEVSGESWFGFAVLRHVSDARADIEDWQPLFSTYPKADVAPAVLLAGRMPFEFPRSVADLLVELEKIGVDKHLLFLILQIGALRTSEDSPMYVILGTPMRGIRGAPKLKQHLTAWRIDKGTTAWLRLKIKATTLQGALDEPDARARVQEIADAAQATITEWASKAEVTWCRVREDRPEIVSRRDIDTPTSWFFGKTVSLWGCGALGGHIAVWLTRAGVRKLILHDNKEVAPGVLARQVYREADLAEPKAIALARYLKLIDPDLEVDSRATNVLVDPLDSDDWTENVDLVIDTTAVSSIRKKLERKWRSQTKRVPVISMLLGHQANCGLVVVSKSFSSGGPSDAIRRLKLVACGRSELKPYSDEFWPVEPRTNLFQPEPGCSEPTFVGSAADVATLAGALLNLAAADIIVAQKSSASGHLVAQANHPSIKISQSHVVVDWEPDLVAVDARGGYEVRISPASWREMRAWISRSARVAGEKETGGLLFGEWDDAARVIWVTEVLGPPPDSQASEEGFVCGVLGTREANTEKAKRSRGSVQYIGMWHTHPVSRATPSSTDLIGMAAILADGSISVTKQLLLIVGETTSSPELGCYVFEREEIIPYRDGVAKFDLQMTTMRRVHPATSRRAERDIGLSLSGGGSRAIAFHLGCLRALRDLGLLDRVEVISAVSGGAVIAAMYAYSNDSFAEFDRRVTAFLRRGLVFDTLRKTLSPLHLLGAGLTVSVPGTLAIASDLTRTGLGTILGLLGLRGHRRPDFVDRIQPPLPRWTSLSTAFRKALRDGVVGDMHLTDARRDAVNVVINACELRTGTAFRFGSRETGCWRYGKVTDANILVAEAVAASAAYPIFLPALHALYEFEDREGVRSHESIVLTDGGVIDNLGITCMEPSRSSEYGYNTYSPETIISCDAGPGIFSDHARPYWWNTRVARSYEAVFRKLQNGAYGRMHEYSQRGDIRAFALIYLGQQDERLPYLPPDLVRRTEVNGYPTDFSPMPQAAIEQITSRGEQLARVLVHRYL